MRNQRRGSATVQLIKVTTNTDTHGNDTAAPDPETVEGALFEPSRAVAQNDPKAPAIVQPAIWSLPGAHVIDSDDKIQHGAQTWFVVGAGVVYRDRTKVPVSQARAV